jgi:hypothetical protein
MQEEGAEDGLAVFRRATSGRKRKEELEFRIYSLWPINYGGGDYSPVM